MTARILVLPGDYIGPEVSAEAEKVLTTLRDRHGLDATWERGLIGGAAVDATGVPLPPETVALAEKADAILVSQVVTQRDAHIHNTQEMSAAFRESYPSDKRPLLVVGGPRFDEKMAGELGVDRVFVRGTTPGEVASYLTHMLVTNRKKVPA